MHIRALCVFSFALCAAHGAVTLADIACWPGVVAPRKVCGQLVRQADIFATLSELWGSLVPANAGEDRVSLMPLLKGGTQPVRGNTISHSSAGVATLRKGEWKLLAAPDPKAGPGAPPVQLYDLAADLGETRNLAQEKPALVAEMLALIGEARERRAKHAGREAGE